jgi:L-histidine N-alpha-methyltransferase
MVKDIKILENAYNDKKQITASFNKNILHSINKIVGTNFNEIDFEHIAFYNKIGNRIEMHLKAKKDIAIQVEENAIDISIKKGELIHTENSHKFNKRDIESFAFWTNMHIEKVMTDNNNWFSLIHYKKK